MKTVFIRNDVVVAIKVKLRMMIYDGDVKHVRLRQSRKKRKMIGGSPRIVGIRSCVLSPCQRETFVGGKLTS